MSNKDIRKPRSSTATGDEHDEAAPKSIKEATTTLVRLNLREAADKSKVDIHAALGVMRAIATASKTPKVKEGLQAVAMIIELLDKRETVQMMKVAAADGAREGLEVGMEVVGDQMGTVMDHVKEMVEEIRQGIAGVAHQMKDGVRDREQAGVTYADATKREVIFPARLAAAVDRQDVKARQVVVRRDKGIEEDQYSLAKLSERELVEKGNLAIEAIEATGEKPEAVSFIAAKKLKGGDTLLLMNSVEARRWLCSGNLAAFMEGFDASSRVRTPMLVVVAEFVPVAFEPNDQGELRMLERDSGMSKGSIKEAAYIKPTHRRTLGQRYAHLKLKLDDRTQANKAIRDGIFILGKMISVRKDEQDPPMCYRCHNIGDGHFAANCKADVELCGHCGMGHRSKECPDPEKKWCHICKKAGHGAGDKTCGTRLQTLEMMRRANPEAGKRYYVEKSNPDTWGEMAERNDGTAEAWRTDGTGGFGRRVASKVGQEKWDMTGLPTAPRGARDRVRLTQTTLETGFKTNQSNQPAGDDLDLEYYPPTAPSDE